MPEREARKLSALARSKGKVNAHARAHVLYAHRCTHTHIFFHAYARTRTRTHLTSTTHITRHAYLPVVKGLPRHSNLLSHASNERLRSNEHSDISIRHQRHNNKYHQAKLSSITFPQLSSRASFIFAYIRVAPKCLILPLLFAYHINLLNLIILFN